MICITCSIITKNDTFAGMSNTGPFTSGLNPALSTRRPGEPLSTSVLAAQLTSGSPAALSKAITLMESSRPQDLPLKIELFKTLDKYNQQVKLRLAISGAPGSGKSTLINALTRNWAEQGKRLAVLAVDPTSVTTGGSLLGDKTRMEDVQSLDQVFIRPSPSRGHLGGVTTHTLENIRLCEAAGYDMTIVETVGVGQSEVEVRQMVDVVVLVLTPFSGDTLQGLKRGIVEIADLVVVNKSDGTQRAHAAETASAYRQALQSLHREVSVLEVSSIEGHGIAELAKSIETIFTNGLQDSRWLHHRLEQSPQRFLSLLQHHLMTGIQHHTDIQNLINSYHRAITAGTQSAELAALQCWHEIQALWLRE